MLWDKRIPIKCKLQLKVILRIKTLALQAISLMTAWDIANPVAASTADLEHITTKNKMLALLIQRHLQVASVAPGKFMIPTMAIAFAETNHDVLGITNMTDTVVVAKDGLTAALAEHALTMGLANVCRLISVEVVHRELIGIPLRIAADLLAATAPQELTSVPAKINAFQIASTAHAEVITIHSWDDAWLNIHDADLAKFGIQMPIAVKTT